MLFILPKTPPSFSRYIFVLPSSSLFFLCQPLLNLWENQIGDSKAYMIVIMSKLEFRKANCLTLL